MKDLQPTFDFSRRVDPVIGHPVLSLGERQRFSRQGQAILDRLKAGPASNRELNAICFGYRQRLSELRKAGHVIVCEKHASGVAVYALTQGE